MTTETILLAVAVLLILLLIGLAGYLAWQLALSLRKSLQTLQEVVENVQAIEKGDSGLRAWVARTQGRPPHHPEAELEETEAHKPPEKDLRGGFTVSQFGAPE